MQTTDDGQPLLACFSRQPFTPEAMAVRGQVAGPFGHCGLRRAGVFWRVKIAAGEHQRIVTGGGAASVRLPQFAAVNTVLSNLKTALSGTYHAFDFAKYAHRYLAELQYLFNRRFNLATILARLLRAAAVTTPQPEHLLCRAEVGR